MASRTPAWTQRDLQRATGITQSTLSRLLTPTQVMNINQLDAICQALGLDTSDVFDSARRVVSEHQADKLRSRIHEVPGDSGHSPNDGGSQHRAG